MNNFAALYITILFGARSTLLHNQTITKHVPPIHEMTEYGSCDRTPSLAAIYVVIGPPPLVVL